MWQGEAGTPPLVGAWGGHWLSSPCAVCILSSFCTSPCLWHTCVVLAVRGKGTIRRALTVTPGWEPAFQRVEGLAEGLAALGTGLSSTSLSSCPALAMGSRQGPWCRQCRCSRGLCWPGPHTQLCPSHLAQASPGSVTPPPPPTPVLFTLFLYTPLTRADHAPFWSHTGLCPC